MLQKVEAKVEKVEDKIDGSLEKVWKAIKEMNTLYVNRLPVWATFLISFLTMFVGALLTAVLRKG